MTEAIGERPRPLEIDYPDNALPSTRMFRLLPGFVDMPDPEYFNTAYSSWSGSAWIGGSETNLYVNGRNEKTSVVIESNTRLEEWIIRDEFSHSLTISLKEIAIPLSVLGESTMQIFSENHINRLWNRFPYMSLTFTEGSDWRHLEDYEHVEYPVRFVNDVDMVKSRCEGFEGLDQAIDVMLELKSVILKASTLPEVEYKRHYPGAGLYKYLS